MIVRDFSNMHLYLDALDERNGSKSWLQSMTLNEILKINILFDNYAHKKIVGNLKEPGTVDVFNGEYNYLMHKLSALKDLNKETMFESPVTVTIKHPTKGTILDPGGTRMLFHNIRSEKLDVMIVDYSDTYKDGTEPKDYKFIVNELNLNSRFHTIGGVYNLDIIPEINIGDTIHYFKNEVKLNGVRVLERTNKKWHLAF